jgi:hypothetical protein
VLEEAGVQPVSYPTVKRRLPGYAKTEFRTGLSGACAARAALGPSALLLYETLVAAEPQDEEPLGSAPEVLDEPLSGRSNQPYSAAIGVDLGGVGPAGDGLPAGRGGGPQSWPPDSRCGRCAEWGRPVRIPYVWRIRTWSCPEPSCPVGVFTKQDEQVGDLHMTTERVSSLVQPVGCTPPRTALGLGRRAGRAHRQRCPILTCRD